MRRFTLPVTALASLLLATGCSKTEPAKSTASPVAAAAPMPKECNPNSPCPGSACLTSITSAAASVPIDACPREGEFQSDVDSFAWNSFVALNWPANLATCAADTSQSIIGGKGPRVWETYALDSDVFVASGKKPPSWCSQAATAALTGARPVGYISKEGSAAIPGIDEAVGGVLTDQTGRFVRYEVKLNQDEYNYLTINNLWNKPGQKGKMINFPQGPNDNPSRCGSIPCGPVGATEIKAAWKVLSPAEISSGRFYTTSATVFNNANGSPSPGKNPVTLGLVGLHILHKTASAPNWFWATFEQVDNTTASFHNPKCPACPPNTQTAAKPYTELSANGTPVNKPVQVVRTSSIISTDSAAPPLNTYYRGLLAGSVFANYELVSLQWTTGGAPSGTPPVLANTTMETYIQSTSSCFGCHKQAKTTSGVSADFSFLLGRAQ